MLFAPLVGCGAKLLNGEAGLDDTGAADAQSVRDTLAPDSHVSDPPSDSAGELPAEDTADDVPAVDSADEAEAPGIPCLDDSTTPTFLVAANGYNLILDATYVYWADTTLGGGGVRRVPKKCGGTPKLVVDDYYGAHGVALDATRVYWTTWWDKALFKRAPLEGGAHVVITAGDWSTGGPGMIAVDGTRGFFTSAAKTVVTVPLSGGTPEVLARGNISRYFAMDHGDLYFGEYGASGSVKKVSKSGGTAVIFAPESYVGDIVVDATAVYWTAWQTSSDGRVMKKSKAGGAVTTLASGESVPSRLALDADNVYWTNQSSGTVRAIAKTGGAARTLATDQPVVEGIAVDETNVYWISYEKKAIFKRRK